MTTPRLPRDNENSKSKIKMKIRIRTMIKSKSKTGSLRQCSLTPTRNLALNHLPNPNPHLNLSLLSSLLPSRRLLLPRRPPIRVAVKMVAQLGRAGANPGDLVGRQSFLPIPDVRLAVALELVDRAAGFARVVLVGMLLDGALDVAGELEPEPFEELREFLDRPARQVFMPAKAPVAMTFLKPADHVMQHIPADNRVIDDVVGPIDEPAQV